MAELQTIPARHGVATFVPAGQVIKIVNTTGTQVVDTWAFALPKPVTKTEAAEKEKESKEEEDGQVKKKKNKKGGAELPSQEDAEKATREAHAQAEKDGAKKSTWSSYVPSLPSLGGGKSKSAPEGDEGEETEQQKNSKTWGSYFTAGKGFSSYIPKQATDTVSQFAGFHERDTSRTYIQQLQDFSQTPVGAAGMAAITGSGYSGSLYAGYQAWNAKSASSSGSMAYMSMPHTRAATLHLTPRVGDTLVTNVREPILTLLEDSSPGIHDTLIAACDPPRYKGLGVEGWETHGSCAENLVLALKELNEKAGLKGARAIGAWVTVNSVPAPLNLFMNIPWNDDGGIGFEGPKGGKGDFVRFRAEGDVVVVMSACPQDVVGINGGVTTEAGFCVEEEGVGEALGRVAAGKKKPVMRKSSGVKTTASENALPKKKALPAKKPPVAPSTTAAASQALTGKPVQKSYTPAMKKAPTGPQPVVKKTATNTSQTPARPMKKPIPPQVKSAVPSTNTPNGDSTPVDKKKPRKLARPQQATAGAES